MSNEKQSAPWRIHKCRRGRQIWHIDEMTTDSEFAMECEYRTGAEALAAFAKGWPTNG